MRVVDWGDVVDGGGWWCGGGVGRCLIRCFVLKGSGAQGAYDPSIRGEHQL